MKIGDKLICKKSFSKGTHKSMILIPGGIYDVELMIGNNMDSISILINNIWFNNNVNSENFIYNFFYTKAQWRDNQINSLND